MNGVPAEMKFETDTFRRGAEALHITSRRVHYLPYTHTHTHTHTHHPLRYVLYFPLLCEI